MQKFTLGMIASLLLLVGLLFSINRDSTQVHRGAKVSGADVEPIKLFCAASNRAVVEKIRADYEAETGRTVDIQYGPSQDLLSQLEVGQSGDLYIPADDSYLRTGQEKGLIRETIPLARMQIVVAVPKGNPKQISSFADLISDKIRLVQANPDGAAVGKQTRQILQESGQWEELDAKTIGYRLTVTDAANDVLIGSADAAIVYDAVLSTYPDLEAVSLPEFEAGVAKIAVGVTSFANPPASAFHFARYLGANDRGQQHYAELGFQAEHGDDWADIPELEIFAGSMLRPAIEETVEKFQEREGVNIVTVFNGCGILVGQMKEEGSQPDAYFACDVEFMNQVRDKFQIPETISQNQLVIIVHEGNPHGISSLRDLGNPGLRVGIGHEKQCAMGWLTQKTFTEGGVQSEVMKNVTVQTPTGDMLVNQMKAGSLDAAVVYLSNTAGSEDVLDAIAITGIPCSQASQPIAIAKQTPYSQLTARFLDVIRSAESKERFLAHGFAWQVNSTN